MVLQGLLIGLITRLVIYQNPGIWDGLFITLCIALLFWLYRSSYGKSPEFTLHMDQEGLLLTDADGKTIEQVSARNIVELRTDFREVNPMAGSLREIIHALVNKPILDKLIVLTNDMEKTFYLLPESDHARQQISQYAQGLVRSNQKAHSLT
jgi:hypothetical protein